MMLQNLIEVISLFDRERPRIAPGSAPSILGATKMDAEASAMSLGAAGSTACLLAEAQRKIKNYSSLSKC
jgi:hypothetical protein